LADFVLCALGDLYPYTKPNITVQEDHDVKTNYIKGFLDDLEHANFLKRAPATTRTSSIVVLPSGSERYSKPKEKRQKVPKKIVRTEAADTSAGEEEGDAAPLTEQVQITSDDVPLDQSSVNNQSEGDERDDSMELVPKKKSDKGEKILKICKITNL
jgi:hypothetical protein